MKTNLLLITVLLFAISCAKEPSAENNQSGADVEYTSMTFKATAEDVTKVLLQNDRVSLHWQAADRIKVFDGVSNDLPAFAASGSGAQVDFHGKVINSEGPFYALYPYQDGATFALDAANDNAPTIYAEVPEIQHAVAGSVPSNAFVAAAISSPDGTLRFKSMLAYIRFTLNDDRAADIESITLSGNDDEALSGLIKITFDNNGNPVDTYTETMSRTVTLVGNFINGEDYMFAIREQAFWKGLTLSILYKDGTRRYISSDYRPLDGSGAHIPMTQNLVMNFGAINSSAMKDTTPPPDRYVAYLHGYNLVIAGETYNIRTHGKPILLKSKDQDTPRDIKSSIHEKSGVFFIDSSLAEVVLNSIPNITGDLVALIGRYEDKPNVFTPKYYAKIASGKFVMMDLDIDTQNLNKDANNRSDYVFTLTDGPGDLEAFHIDGCKIKNLHRRLLVYHESNTRKIKGLMLVNSDIGIEANPNYNTIQIFYLQQYKDLHTIKEITFDNNIVYHNYTPSSSMATTCRIVDVLTSGFKDDEQWDAVVSICNNTIYNLPSPWAYFNYYKVASLEMNKNISAVSDSYDAYSGCMCLFRGEQSGDVIDISDNVYYGLTNKVWFVANDASLWKPANNVMTQYESAVNPFQTVDFETGTFTPLPQYATYGAQR